MTTPEERNRLARQLFNAVRIENRTAVEVTPRPDLLPFFAKLASSSVTQGRKRRGADPHIPQTDPTRPSRLVLPFDLVPVTGDQRRATGRDYGQLSDAVTRQAGLLRAEGLALSEIGDNLGASHEAIRSALRRPPAVATENVMSMSNKGSTSG